MPTNVQYIGKRPEYNDGLYGTGHWTKGQIKPVHDLTAAKMFKHRDQYAPVEDAPPETAEADVLGEPQKPTDEETAEQDLQAARDAVALMDKDTAINYAQVHFRQQLDKRMSVENVRAKVIGLIDQYGLT